LDATVPGHRTWVFGHAGDGNLHLVCSMAQDSALTSRQRLAIETAVYEPLKACAGSVSGEHGIGLEKKHWLSISRSTAEIELMQLLKRTLDPRGILNPGRVVDAVVET
jgi:FAD/FMN-containing dehydrogenase